MWLKVIGSTLVTISCGALGAWKARQWKEHRKMLEQIRKMILLLKGEILYAHSTLGEALDQVGKKSEGVLAEIFCQVSERIQKQEGERFFTIWSQEMDSRQKELFLTPKERQELKEFGQHLGYLDLEMQERTIALYLEQLELAIQFYRDHEQEQTKLYTSLGVMGGLFLSIMLC